MTTGLLNRQFASITDTLVKASRRREEELQVRMSMPPKATSAMRVTAFRNKLLATTEPDLSLSSDSGDSSMGLDQSYEGSEDIASDGKSEPTLAATASGNSDVHVFLRGGHDPDNTNASRKILAELEKTKKYLDLRTEEEKEDRYLVQLLAEMGSSASLAKTSHSVYDDPKALLAKIEGETQVLSDTNAQDDTHSSDDPKRMVAELDRLVEAANQNSTHHVQSDGRGPKEMLEEINRLSLTAKHLDSGANEADSLEDPKVMLAAIGRMKQASGQDLLEDDDLETLRGRLATMLSSFSLLTFATVEADTATQPQPQLATAATLDPEVIPHILALMMESGGYKWEELDGWCKYLFNSDADAYRAKQESDQMVKSENEKLDATIAYVIEEEKKYRAIEEKKRLPCRLIVSNLAASVDEEAIRIFFSEYRWDMRDIIILPERDPVKRTRTAYIDMYSRKTAVRASFDTGGIFGLAVKIKLAVE